jgi:hypothetical protein
MRHLSTSHHSHVLGHNLLNPMTLAINHHTNWDFIMTQWPHISLAIFFFVSYLTTLHFLAWISYPSCWFFFFNPAILSHMLAFKRMEVVEGGVVLCYIQFDPCCLWISKTRGISRHLTALLKDKERIVYETG